MASLPLLDDAGNPILDEAGVPLLDEASTGGAFSPTAFASTSFNTGAEVTGTVAPSVSVTVPPPGVTIVPSGQYVGGLGQLVSLGANPGGHAGQGLILYPDTGG